MAESELHKSMKPVMARWLKVEHGCGVTAIEPEINKLWKMYCRPDVIGVCTHHPESGRLGYLHDVECEPELPGIRAEYQKEYRTNPYRSIADYEWLAYPAGIEPCPEALRIPKWVGMVSVFESGVIQIEREPKLLSNRRSPYAERMRTLLLASLIQNYERETGKSPDRVRPAAKAKAKDGDIVKKIAECFRLNADNLANELPIRFIADHTGEEIKDIRQVVRKGIPGYTPGPLNKSLIQEEPVTASK